MSKDVPKEELDNFEKLIDKEDYEEEDRTKEIKAWLDKNCPQYNEIIKEVALELEKELIQYKNQIPGTKGYNQP